MNVRPRTRRPAWIPVVIQLTTAPAEPVSVVVRAVLITLPAVPPDHAPERRPVDSSKMSPLLGMWMVRPVG